MRNSAAIRQAVQTYPEADAADNFAFELARLTHKFGIGIGGSPVLFVIEQDDGNLSYEVDGDSNLTITSA